MEHNAEVEITNPIEKIVQDEVATLEAKVKRTDLRLERNRTDNANATKFVDINKERIRFVPSWQKWITWDGRRWCLDEGKNQITCWAREFVSSLWDEATTILRSDDIESGEINKVLRFVKASNDRTRIKACVDLAESDERITIMHSELNKHRHLLNVQNGTLNLDTCELQPHCKGDLITQMSSFVYDSEATGEMWDTTLKLIFDDDTELISYGPGK